MRFKRLAWRETDPRIGVICDHTIASTVFYFKQAYPKPLRHVRFRDPEIGKNPALPINHRDLDPLAICQRYKMRWQVELFFN